MSCKIIASAAALSTVLASGAFAGAQPAVPGVTMPATTTIVVSTINDSVLVSPIRIIFVDGRLSFSLEGK
jgi:hypothetical protein